MASTPCVGVACENYLLASQFWCLSVGEYECEIGSFLILTHTKSLYKEQQEMSHLTNPSHC